MKIDLKFVQLHAPLFLAGVNFGEKLYPTSKGGIKLWYDTEEKHTFVCYNGEVSMIEQTASKTMSDPKQLGINPSDSMFKKPVLAPAPVPVTSWKGAQVEDPISKPPKTIIRRAKYQGEEVPEK